MVLPRIGNLNFTKRKRTTFTVHTDSWTGLSPVTQCITLTSCRRTYIILFIQNLLVSSCHFIPHISFLIHSSFIPHISFLIFHSSYFLPHTKSFSVLISFHSSYPHSQPSQIHFLMLHISQSSSDNDYKQEVLQYL